MTQLFAGLDVSTQSCKLIILNTSLQKIMFSHSLNYDKDLPHYNTENGTVKGLEEGVSESDPNMWIEAVENVFAIAKSQGIDFSNIACISVSGQQHGLVALDSDGNLSRRYSKLWNDFSTQEECDILHDLTGGIENMVREVGNSQRTGYTASKIFHMMRHEPETYHKTDTFFLVHNYINWFLTGGVKVMEYGDTSGTALWNPAARNWSKKIIQAIDPELIKKLPDVVIPHKTIGTVSQKLVQKFGFNPSCRIDAGSGDNMYGAVGTGNVVPGIVTISLGSSGTAYTFLEEPYIDLSGEIACFCDSTGNYLPLLCVSNLANGYNDYLKQYNLTHEDFNRIIKKTKPGNAGRILLPWYEGERTPDLPLAAPVYFGFKTGDFTREILCRALLEAHVLNLYNGFKKMPVHVNEIRLTGGLAKSESWCQAIADIFEADTLPVRGEGAAMGAALHAAWVWEAENGNRQPISEFIAPYIELETKLRKKPIPDNVKQYKKQKKLFEAISLRIRGLNGDDPFKLRMQLI